jgi:tetratricopeptide (TPR) repeat protein/tRNA A-37 threonylcarbamoyl transferase component Bud32
MKRDSEKVEELFFAALSHPRETRSAFVRTVCADDVELEREVSSMLQAHEEAHFFLETPAFEINAHLWAEQEAILRPGELIGSYAVISLIAKGGMGEVYLADDVELKRKVAVKLIRRYIGAALPQHLRREARILATLNHPGIARLYGAAVSSEGVPYFVMEYVEGERLDRYCEQRQLPLAGKLVLFRKVCAAVSYAHQHLVIHRDLKPANIRVTIEGEPKLLDFGIAKVLDEQTGEAGELTTSLEGVMTPRYASPEQLEGRPITTVSDIYSLGVVLCELLTGIRPTDLKTPSASAEKQESRAQLPEIRKLPGELQKIVRMAIRTEPARRYGSVGQLSEDIRRYMEKLPVHAQKDTVGYRAQKFIQRHRVGAFVAITFVLTLVIGIVATMREATLAKEQRDNARVAQTTAERLNQFLQGLLASADPDGMGRDVKVVQVLDAAAAGLDKELAAEPKVLAEAHLTMARAYLQLRIPNRAESHARAALTIDERIFGRDNPATGRAMAFLGEALKVFHRPMDAESFLRSALVIERKQSPKGSSELAATLLNLGAVLTTNGRLKDAKPLIEESLSLSRKIKGPASVQVADALNSLGNVERESGDAIGAEKAYRQALSIHRQLKPMRVTFLNPLDNLCVLLFRQGKLDEVEELLREGQTYCKENIGEDNPTYGFILGRLGLIDFVKGRYADAIPRLQRCLETLRNVYPRTDTDMVLTKAALGVALVRSNQPERAEPYLREALDEGKETSRGDLAPIGNLEGALGECLLMEKKITEAEPLLRASYNEFRMRLGDKDAITLTAKSRISALADLAKTSGE